MDNVMELHRFIIYLQKKASQGDAKAKQVVDEYLAMEQELHALRAFKANVDEALNTGDGSYRP